MTGKPDLLASSLENALAPSRLLHRLALTPQTSISQSATLVASARPWRSQPPIENAPSRISHIRHLNRKFSIRAALFKGNGQPFNEENHAKAHLSPRPALGGTGTDGTKMIVGSSSVFRSEFDYEYCIASPYNPYCLSQVHHEAIGDDFYLSSPLGLTHKHKHGGVEFVTLEEHERQAALFIALKSIPFFRRFPKWRTFMAWRKSTKSHKLSRCKKALQHELFLLHPMHRSCLLQLRLMCQKLWRLRLFDVQSSTGSISQFGDRQAQQKSEVELQIESCMESVHNLILRSCRKSLADFLESCGFGVATSGGGYTQRAAMRAHCQKLVKFLRLVDFQIAEVYLQVATSSVSEMMRACLEADTVLDSKFTIQMHHDINSREAAACAAANPDAALASAIALRVFGETSSAAAVADAVAGAVIGSEPAKESLEAGGPLQRVLRPLFRICLEFITPTQKLMPSPSGPELKAHLREIIADGLGILTSPPRLLSDKEFSPFVSAADEASALDQSLDLNSILSVNQDFQFMLSRIYACLDNASMYAVAYARGFDRFMQSLREHDLFLEQAELECPHSLLKDAKLGASSHIRNSIPGNDNGHGTFAYTLNLTIAELETLLARYVAESAVFAALPETQFVGMILVDSSSVCAALRPSPDKCLRVARMHGPHLYNSRTNLLLQKLAQQHEALSIVPVRVDDYVKLTQTLATANSILPTLHDACELLGTLHTLLVAYDSPIPETTINCAVLLKNLDTQVRSSLNNANTAVQEGAPQFTEQINAEVGALRAPTLSVKAELYPVSLHFSCYRASKRLSIHLG